MKNITSSRFVNLLAVLTLCFVSALILTNTVTSEGPKNIGAGKAKEAVRMFEVGKGPRAFNFQLGRETETRYLGSAALLQAAQSAQIQPRSMASDDFNGDGMGDLVIGYADNGSGVLSLRQGNEQAIAPSNPDVFNGITQGRYPSPFLTEATLYALPEAPDFLQVGDFNADGHADVLAAGRGASRMYLFAGDGTGRLGKPETFEVPGLLTALRADQAQLGKFTNVAVGLFAAGGAKLAVYNKAEGLSAAPQSFDMSGEVTSLAFDQLDDDGISDLAAATTSQVVVIRGRNDLLAESAADSSLVETQNVPFVIRGLATGNFMFDRNHQREIALLADDGTVYLTTRGNPDTRPFSQAEKEIISHLRRSFALHKIDMETLTAETNKLIRANNVAAWNVAETLNSGIVPSNSGQTIFQRSNAASLKTDDLLIGDGFNNRVEVVRNELDAAKLQIKGAPKAIDPQSVSGAPIAAVSMRLNVNAIPGTVILGANEIEPNVVLSPTAVFTVNSTADLPDSVPTSANGVCLASNGLCTLRAAIMQSNHTGGSNTIMVPDGTYTLTLGPPDDEANTGGALEQSGDLDIFSWADFDGSPILTAVSITGGTRDGCIIQMGTLAPTLATAVPNNKERILQVNDSATGAGQDRVNVTLTNLTMQNAVEPTGSGTFLDGGAVRFDGFDFTSNTNIGLLTLHNARLQANTSAGFGGGVFVGFGSLVIESTSIVRANTAQHKVGGGVGWTGGNTVETQFFRLDGSTVGGALVADGNLATDTTFGAGAGIDVRGGLSVTVQNSSVIQNNVGSVQSGTIGGGGIQINSPSVVFSTSSINNNSCRSNGGGIFSSARNAVTNATSTLTMTTMNVNGNVADSDNSGAGDGGGLYNFFGTATIQTTSHVDGNTAINGGGIFNAWTGIPADFTAGLTVQTSSTIGQAGAGNGNSAKNNGGSIAVSQVGATNFGPINFNTLTFTNNTANSDSSGGGDGGAIFISAGTITSLNACTFDSNVANSGTGDGIRQTGGTITGAGTLNVNGGDSISITGGTFNSTPGTLNLTGNLLKVGGTFGANGGTVNCNGSSAQTIGSDAMTFNNLTINNAAGVNLTGSHTVSGTLTLTNGVLGVATNTLTLNGPVSFTSGTIGSSATGTVNYNQGAGGQIVAPGSYGNLTFSNFAKVLPNGLTVGIAGTFTPGAGVHTITGSTIDFNGAGAQTIPATNYFNLTSSNAGARTLANAGTIGIAGAFTPGGNTYTITGSTIDFNGAGAQTITAFNYNNLTSSNAGARTLANAGTIGIAGAFTPGGNTYTITGSTIEYNGTSAQALPSGFTTYNNLTLNNAAGTTGFAGLTVNGLIEVKAGTFTSSSTYNNVQIDSGATLAATAASTINVSGNWTNNGGTFTPNTGTVNFNGSSLQTIGGTVGQTFNNLTVSNAAGVNMSFDNTVNGVLALTSGDITVAATRTLTQPLGGTSSGGFDVNGQVQRNGFVTGGAALSFGNPFNSIQVTAGTAPANIVVNLARSVPTGGQGFPTAVQRTYTITPNTTAFTATVRLHYLTAELNLNNPTLLNLWRFDSTLPTPGWRPNPATARDCAAGCTTNNSQFWAERSGVTSFSPWTLNSTVAPTASGSVITGRIVDNDGNPVAGAVVRLSGTQNRKFITDANGNYRFENVETNGFYTVTPSRANYTFNPATRSFSQLGESTEAAFGATVATSNLVNPLDTPEYFVRQHYLDFLGREPDEAGFNFWSDQIISCGADTDCVAHRRDNVSAAYFLSIEFQQTGGLVDGLYRSAYGVRPDFAAFMPDVRTVGTGVVVGNEGWEAKLQANKQAFVDSFVNRAAFHTAFDNLSNEDYVATLLSHTGVAFTLAEREALVSSLNNNSATRADVLRSIAENSRFVNAKFNETFVMTEYFGYLRRDPDASGFAFWLQKLNQFNGNFEQAEMVKAFIVSSEFRDRFPR